MAEGAKSSSPRRSMRLRRQRLCSCFKDEADYKTSNKRLLSFLQEKKFVDIDVVSTDEVVIPAHRIILTRNILRSFNPEGAPPKLVRVPFESKVVRELLTHIYSGSCEIDDSNKRQLLEAAKMYGMLGLNKDVGRFWMAQLNVHNALETLKICNEFFCHVFVDNVKKFMMDHFHNLDGLESYPVALLKELMKDDYLASTEEELFQFVDSLYTNNILRRDDILSLLRTIRFTRMDNIFYYKIVRQSATFKNFKKLFKNADDFHMKRVTRSPMRFSEKARVPKKHIYSIGGWETEDDNLTRGPTAKMEIFKPNLTRWEATDLTLPSPRAYHGTAIIKDCLYVYGGYRADHQNPEESGVLDSGIKLDLKTGAWSSIASLNEGRVYPAFTQSDTEIFVLGGHDFTDPHSRMFSMEKYDTVTDTWTSVADMMTARSDFGSVFIDDKIYAIGGFDGEHITNEVEYYDMDMGSWITGPPLMSQRSGHRAVVLDRKIYAIGGFDGTSRLRTVEVLDLDDIDPHWVQGPSMREMRSNYGVTVMNGKIYVVGGYNGIRPCNDVESFCPLANAWRDEPIATTKKSALSLEACPPPERFKTIKHK